MWKNDGSKNDILCDKCGGEGGEKGSVLIGNQIIGELDEQCSRDMKDYLSQSFQERASICGWCKSPINGDGLFLAVSNERISVIHTGCRMYVERCIRKKLKTRPGPTEPETILYNYEHVRIGEDYRMPLLHNPGTRPTEDCRIADEKKPCYVARQCYQCKRIVMFNLTEKICYHEDPLCEEFVKTLEKLPFDEYFEKCEILT